ncbi:hypothetical protein DVJ77_20185, partial [Dyella tabacisoli]
MKVAIATSLWESAGLGKSLVGGVARLFACGGLSDPCRGPSHFLLSGQEKVTKEKATPMQRSAGILPCECVRLGRAFRQGFLPWR